MPRPPRTPCRACRLHRPCLFLRLSTTTCCGEGKWPGQRAAVRAPCKQACSKAPGRVACSRRSRSDSGRPKDPRGMQGCCGMRARTHTHTRTRWRAPPPSHTASIRAAWLAHTHTQTHTQQAVLLLACAASVFACLRSACGGPSVRVTPACRPGGHAQRAGVGGEGGARAAVCRGPQPLRHNRSGALLQSQRRQWREAAVAALAPGGG